MSCPAGRSFSCSFAVKSASGSTSREADAMMVLKLSTVEYSTCIRAGRLARAQITAEPSETSPDWMPPAICGRAAARLSDGFASVPSEATARLEVERTRNCRRVHSREARSDAIQETFVESRRKVPAPFDSYPYGFLTPRLRFCDVGMTGQFGSFPRSYGAPTSFARAERAG